MSSSKYLLEIRLLTYGPPCPSKTANKEFPSPISNEVIDWSSIDLRHPCISHNAYLILVFCETP